MALVLDSEMSPSPSKRARWEEEFLSFSRNDKKGAFQPHDDALVVMLRVVGFDVRRVMINQESGVEVMYLDLY